MRFNFLKNSQSRPCKAPGCSFPQVKLLIVLQPYKWFQPISKQPHNLCNWATHHPQSLVRMRMLQPGVCSFTLQVKLHQWASKSRTWFKCTVTVNFFVVNNTLTVPLWYLNNSLRHEYNFTTLGTLWNRCRDIQGCCLVYCKGWEMLPWFWIILNHLVLLLLLLLPWRGGLTRTAAVLGEGQISTAFPCILQ